MKDELGEALLEGYRERTQLKAARERIRALEQHLDELRRALGIADDLSSAPRVRPITRRERTSGLREATPVIMCSDWHVGETVKSETVNGMNAFNPRICRERHAKLVESVRWEIAHERHGFAIRDAILWLGGDLITGQIHEELIEGNSMSPTQEVLFAQELCEAMIDDLLEQEIERVVVVCNHGNHGRTTQKKRISTGAFNSFEWLMYKSLERRYASEKRVEFVVSDGAMAYSKIYDTVLRTTHGDAIKYAGGVGGITVPILRKVSQWNKARHAHATVLGHFHQRFTLGGVNGNGSLIGYGPFSQFIGAEPEPPAQGMFLIDSRRGACHPKELWCDGRADRSGASDHRGSPPPGPSSSGGRTRRRAQGGG